MSTIPTQNPVPSEAPRDLKYNSGKVDEFVTSMKNKYIDRFGQEHFTIEGLRWVAQQAISQFGYITLDSFQKGVEITLPNQVLRDEVTGEYYRWDGELPKLVPVGSTPDSSGGLGIGLWVSVGDASLRNNLSENTGASLVNTTAGMSVQKYIDGLTLTTKQLNITNSDQLISALDEHGAIIVNSDVIIDKYTIIPSHSNVINGGGLFRLVNSDSCISIRPNVKFDCDIYDTSDTPLSISAIHIDGKIDNPRWYVGEHETKIKSFIRSNKRLGIAVFFDGVSESNKRALISGVEIDVVVSRFEYACLMKADHSKYGIHDERKTYITSNRVSVVSGGSTYCLKELYSSDVKPILEEIGGNVFYLEHQTVIETHYPLHSVGRLSIYECNFWDSHVAENTDQIIVSGNDNYIFGANLPSRRSKYVSITGERNYYHGVTYGKPETSVNSLMINDTAHFLWGGARLPLSSLLDTTSNDIVVKGESSSQGNVIFDKKIKDAMLKSPISIDVSTVFEMLDSNSTANIVLTINGYNFYLNGTSKVISFNLKVVANKDKVKIYGNVNNSTHRVERFGRSDNDDISIKMVVYSNKADKSGELIFHEAKINFFQV
ncbi:hypothetical protein [Proteus vulgaris]|uniref:tail fiber/spike domain-containing protein n=1 Tax=Proteus vulgaris TaxID=585 RepID=UPI0032D9B713